MEKKCRKIFFIVILGRDTLIHHICTGLNPANYSGVERDKKFWRNSVLYFVAILSFTIHIFLWFKIRNYKRKFDPGRSVLKKTILVTLEKQSLTDMLTGFWYVLLICLSMTLLYRLNSMDPEKAHIFPNYILIYFYHFGILNVICMSTALMYYVRHADMRAGMIREVKEKLNHFYLNTIHSTM